MKRLFLALTLIFGSHVHAASIGYISDEFRVPLRSTPCNSCKIVHKGLKSGTQFTILEKNAKGWVHVRTSGGTEGWLPTQYLTTEKIARLRVDEAEKQVAELMAENIQLNTKVQELESTLTTTANELNQFSEEKNTINQKFIALQMISENSVNINKQNQELLKQNSILQNEVDFLTNANNNLKGDKDLQWFAYGSLAVIAGVLLALVLPNLKRKRRFTEWG